jgi:hypothetical protein
MLGLGKVAAKEVYAALDATARMLDPATDLWPVAAVVAAVTMLRQFAAASFEVSGGERRRAAARPP